MKTDKGTEMKDCLVLFWAFFKIGGFTFGGGLSMLPMLKYELVEKKGWIDEERLLDCYAIGQCTPGIIAVNTATYVGYLKKGLMGAIFSTLGMITPSVVIITTIFYFLNSYLGNPWVQHALAGIKGVVCALMLHTVISLVKKSVKSVVFALIAAGAMGVALFTNCPTVLIVVVAAIMGMSYEAVKGGKKNE